jgi:arylsulfatase A-like enzyme
MPVLDRLLEGGTLFRQAFSNAPYTRVSVPSFQTSRYLGYDALDDFPTLGSILREEGIQTTIIGTQTGIGLVDGQFDYGEHVDLGRDEFNERANATRPMQERISRQVDKVAETVGATLRKHGAESVVRTLKKPYKAVFTTGGFRYQGYTAASEVTDRAIEWLENNGDDEFFLWIHYMEAHRPFGVHDDDPEYLESPLPEKEIKRLLKKVNVNPEAVTPEEHQTLIDLYDSDIRYCSRHLTRLLDYLADEGIAETTNFLFSSDHGEEFGEHGRYGHRNYPYEELVHVPLIVRTPNEQPAEITEQRELVDLLPTICAFQGVDTSEYQIVGEDLFEGEERDVFLLGQPKDEPSTVSVRRDLWKYIHAPGNEQLYNLKDDPGETTNVLADNPAVADELRDTIPEYLVEREVKELRDPKNKVDKERLAALGYLEDE